MAELKSRSLVWIIGWYVYTLHLIVDSHSKLNTPYSNRIIEILHNTRGGIVLLIQSKSNVLRGEGGEIQVPDGYIIVIYNLYDTNSAPRLSFLFNAQLTEV